MRTNLAALSPTMSDGVFLLVVVGDPFGYVVLELRVEDVSVRVPEHALAFL